MQHRHDNKQIISPSLSGHIGIWVKVSHFYNIFQKYDIVVVVDTDTYLTQPRISI